MKNDKTISPLSFRRTLALYVRALILPMDPFWTFFTFTLIGSCLFFVAIFMLIPAYGKISHWPSVFFTLLNLLPLCLAYSLITPPKGPRPNFLLLALLPLFSFTLGFLALQLYVDLVFLKNTQLDTGLFSSIIFTTAASSLLSLLLNWGFILRILPRFDLFLISCFHFILQIPQKLRQHVQETIRSDSGKRVRLEAEALNRAPPPAH